MGKIDLIIAEEARQKSTENMLMSEKEIEYVNLKISENILYGEFSAYVENISQQMEEHLLNSRYTITTNLNSRVYKISW